MFYTNPDTLLIFFEEGGARYFHTPTDDAFCRTVAYVIKARLSDPNFYCPINDIQFTHKAYYFINQMKSADFNDQNTSYEMTEWAFNLLNERSGRNKEKFNLVRLEFF